MGRGWSVLLGRGLTLDLLGNSSSLLLVSPSLGWAALPEHHLLAELQPGRALLSSLAPLGFCSLHFTPFCCCLPPTAIPWRCPTSTGCADPRWVVAPADVGPWFHDP